ncbi:MAG: glycosyltransferase family 4 protein [Caldilineaceae bacterium]
MHILFTVHKYPPESLGGTEIYTLTLARALVKAGHQITVFYPTAQVAVITQVRGEDGIQLWQIPLPANRNTENPARQFWHTFRDQSIEAAFVDCLAQSAPDLIHFQHVQGVSARLIELAAAYPKVATLHDYWYFCANSQLIRPDRRPCAGPSFGNWNCVDCATARADLQLLRVARPLVALPFAWRNHYLRRMAAQINCFIAPSEFLRQQYINQGWPAAKIVTLENGMDRHRLLHGRSAAVPPPLARPHFGFLGSLAWQKGVHILIEAFNQLPPTAALTIYGSEQAFPAYGAEMHKLATHPNIRFAGALAYEEVGAALRQLDALVVPSLWYENSPLVIQEAYVVGVPVIASDLGALPEKVHANRSGRLFPPGDSAALTALLQESIEHPERLAQLKSTITPPPTVEEHADQICHLYHKLLA